MIHDNLVAGNPYEVIYADNIPSDSPVNTLTVKFLANKYDTLHIQMDGYGNADNSPRSIYYDLNTTHTWDGNYLYGGLSATSPVETGNGYSGANYAVLGFNPWSDNFHFSLDHTIHLNPGANGYITSTGTYMVQRNAAYHLVGSAGNITSTQTPPVEPTSITVGLNTAGTSFYGRVKVVGERRILKGW
jgi:hypothetical protein